MWSLRSTRIAVAISVATSIALTPSRLLGVPGVEAALILGICLPPLVGVVSARALYRRRRLGLTLAPSRSFAGGLHASLLLWGLPFIILSLNGLRVGNCRPLEGAAFMTLGPGLGCLLASVVGTAVATWIPFGAMAAVVAGTLPVLSAGYGITQFWNSPAIFVFDHFVGWFPGTLYDEDVRLAGSYFSFRGVSGAIGVGVASLTVLLRTPVRVASLLRQLSHRWLSAILAITMLSGAAVATAYGNELGHRSSSPFIAKELGATGHGKRCTVHAPRETSAASLRRLRDDCDFRVAQAETVLAVNHPRRLHAFFFRSAEEKKRYMGAGQTFIAKPWRSEVYLQYRPWPHPVLFHEVVHVVAGNLASGPFRVAGQWGGWVPDPALIEGLAVAGAWSTRDGLDPHQWAATLLHLDLAPPLDAVLGLSFLTQPPRNAYTIAGSFMRWLRDQRGIRVVQELYRTGNVQAATGESPETLDSQWRAFLKRQPIPKGAAELARERFQRKAVFSARCPHRVAELRKALGEDLSTYDHTSAIRTCRRILAADPEDRYSQATLVGVLARTSQWTAARRALQDLENKESPPSLVGRARLALGDAAWAAGDRESARRWFRTLADYPHTEEQARAIEVRNLALNDASQAEQFFRELLAGRGARGAASGVKATHLARRIAETRSDGLGAYLEARQLLFHEQYALARPLIQQAQRLGLPTELLQKEANRMLGLSWVATGQLAKADGLWRGVATDPRSSHADQLQAQDWLERVSYLAERQSGAL